MTPPQFRSLSTQLLRRAALLTFISVFGLVSTISLLFLNRIDQVKRQITESNTEAVGIFDLYFIKLQASIVSASNVLRASDNARYYLLQIAALNPSITNILVLNSEGELSYQYHTSGRPNISDYNQDWLNEEDLIPGETVTNQFSYDQQVPTVEIATPLTDDLGLSAGVMIVRVDLTELWNQTLSIKVGQSGYAYIVDQGGNVVSHRNRRFLSSQSSTLDKLLGKTPQEIAADGFSMRRGIDTHLVFTSGQALETMPWLTIVEQPIWESIRPILIPGVGLLTILLLVLYLLYEVINFFRARMVQPLNALSTAIQNTERGKALPAIAMGSQFSDEFSQLATVLLETSQENADLYHSLEEKVSIRTQELQQEVQERQQTEVKLKTAKKQAEEASRAKSEFLANMSHELRTPLNGILGYAQILARSSRISPDTHRGVDIIYQCGSHLLTLINDILDLSKIEARKLELMPAPVHFPSLLQSVVEMCKIKADQKGVEFIYQPSSRLPEGIATDEKRLRQVLINLLGNAIKFTELGSVALRVDVVCVSDTTVSLLFQVIDTGIGIAETDAQKLFQAFEQVGDQKKQAEGTGLGLAISQRIVELMGGEIQVRSQLGEGSEFFFTVELPVVEDWIEQQVTLKGGDRIVGYGGDRCTILVIDDRWENRAVIQNLLAPIGFSILEAADGQDGWTQLSEDEPDLVITDLSMPVMDGYQFLQKVRNDDTLAASKVIVSSASVTHVDQQTALDAGGDVFLPKPVDADALFDAIATLLSLEWSYAEKPEENGAEIVMASCVLPDRPVLQTLLNLANTGQIAEIRKIVTTLVETNDQYAPFTNNILALAKQFQLEEIEELLQTYIQEQPVSHVG